MLQAKYFPIKATNMTTITNQCGVRISDPKVSFPLSKMLVSLTQNTIHSVLMFMNNLQTIQIKAYLLP